MSAGRFALLIAGQQFDDPGLIRLVSPAEDVQSLRQILADPTIGGFDVQTSVNRPFREVARTVEAFFADRRRDDLLLLYFTGHGLKDDRGRLFFAMTDTERRYLGATALAAAFLHDVMERSRSRSNVLVLDCCYSGAFATSRTAKGDPAMHTSERFQSRGRTVLTASDSMQFSFEGVAVERKRPLSVFTGLIVQGLASGAADRDQDGYIDVDELYDYVNDRMRDVAPEQSPGKWQWDVQGRIVIANSPRAFSGTVRPAPSILAPVPRDANGKPVRRPSRREVLCSAAGTALALAGAGGWGALKLLSDGGGARPWSFETSGEVYSSPVVVSDTVYVGCRDGNLYALDMTGARRWRYPTGNSITSSPAVAGGIVFVGCDDHHVYAVDAATGSLRWKFATGATVHSSPAVAGDTVYVGSRDHNLYALDARTGTLRWRFTGEHWFNSSPTVDGNTVYIGCRDTNVYAIDVATGKQRWRYTTASTVDSSAAVSGATVWIGSDDKSLYALASATGSWIWQFHADGGFVSTPVVDGGVLYIGCDDGNLYAVDATTGRMRWRYTTGNGIRSSPSVAAASYMWEVEIATSTPSMRWPASYGGASRQRGRWTTHRQRWLEGSYSLGAWTAVYTLFGPPTVLVRNADHGQLETDRGHLIEFDFC